MTPNEVRKLKIGDRVVFSDGVKGTVTERLALGWIVTWDDGQHGGIHYADWGNIEHEPIPAIDLGPA